MAAVRVPFVDLARQHAPLAAELQGAFERVVGASAFVLGEEVEQFEREFAAYCQTRHCVGVASGTAALGLALQAAGIGRGDEVIVPAHTFIASALAVLHAGATPVFCDVDDATGLIDPGSAAAVVTPRTAAILPVHLYGQVCDMDAVARVAERERLAVFEDAAQAHGATFRGRRAGSFGRAGCFSFYPSKNLGALGDGGAVCTNDGELARRVRALRDLGQLRKGRHELAGYNERLDALQAALLRVKLPYLDGWNEARRGHASAYREALDGCVRLLEEDARGRCVYHIFPIRVGDRDELAGRLALGGVETGVHYCPPCHRQPPIAERFSTRGEFPVASSWAEEELSLPVFAHLRPEARAHVVKTCLAAIESVAV